MAFRLAIASLSSTSRLGAAVSMGLTRFILVSACISYAAAVTDKRSAHLPTRHTFTEYHNAVAIPVPQPVPILVPRAVPVPVPVGVPVEKPRPVPVDVPHPVAHIVPRPYAVPVDRPFPYPYAQPVPFSVTQPVGIPVPQPYHIAFPSAVPVRVAQPVPVLAHYGPRPYGEAHAYGHYGQVIESHGHAIAHPY